MPRRMEVQLKEILAGFVSERKLLLCFALDWFGLFGEKKNYMSQNEKATFDISGNLFFITPSF